jgi:anaerobic ribonucleoside-triphosphate reductase activating protein
MTAFPVRHHGASTDVIRVARVEDETLVLGPGERSVVWVQGCALRCRGCIVPESHALDGGTSMAPRELADRLLAAGAADGVTFSGGEPFLQPRGLTETVSLLRAERRDWTFMSYSGYRLEALEQRGSADQRAFLALLDLLVDGPYIERMAASVRWRGSANQRIHALTGAGERQMAGLDDSSQGIEIAIGVDGRFAWTGVPPAGFRDALDAAFARTGTVVTHHAGKEPA